MPNDGGGNNAKTLGIAVSYGARIVMNTVRLLRVKCRAGQHDFIVQQARIGAEAVSVSELSLRSPRAEND
jgi:hypothetical protein